MREHAHRYPVRCWCCYFTAHRVATEFIIMCSCAVAKEYSAQRDRVTQTNVRCVALYSTNGVLIGTYRMSTRGLKPYGPSCSLVARCTLRGRLVGRGRQVQTNGAVYEYTYE